MMKSKLALRLDHGKSKENIQKLRDFLSPKQADESVPSSNILQKRKSSHLSEEIKEDVFIPYNNERDSLGRLKNLTSRRSTQHETDSQRMPSLPRVQQSIYNNLKETGVTEPIDLMANQQFKIVDGFERQINIIIRNKEFMSFLKEEKSKKNFTI